MGVSLDGSPWDVGYYSAEILHPFEVEGQRLMGETQGAISGVDVVGARSQGTIGNDRVQSRGSLSRRGRQMNKVLGLILVCSIALGSVPFARSIERPADRPPGIAEANWVPMGVAAGFVITTVANDMRNGMRDEPNVLAGYFMVRHGKSWVRVQSTETGVYRAAERL
jgi:hypothetical protein